MAWFYAKLPIFNVIIFIVTKLVAGTLFNSTFHDVHLICTIYTG